MDVSIAPKKRNAGADVVGKSLEKLVPVFGLVLKAVVTEKTLKEE